MAWRVLNQLAGPGVATATSVAPTAVLAGHGTAGLIAAAVVACVGLLATHGLWLVAALLSERNQRWRYGCTSEEDKELRERILTYDPYTEMARIRRGVSGARTAAGDGTRGAGEAKRRGDKDGRRRP